MAEPSEIKGRVEAAVLGSGTVQPGDRLLVAVSGGQDSVALALALRELQEPLGLLLLLGHVNHGLRGEESDGDEESVRVLGARLALVVEVVRLDLGARGEGGLEEVARRERLAALRRMAQTHELPRIALGHTATDRAETVLMNVLRGTGLDGLAAMRAAAGDLIRPLLGVNRAATAAYCAAAGVIPRYDSSNDDLAILRNRLRLRLLPLLEGDYQPGIERSLVRLGEIAEAEVEWTAPVVEGFYGECAKRHRQGVALDLAKLEGMPPGLRWRVLRRAAVEVRGDLRHLGLDHVRGLDGLLMTGRTGQQAEAPGLIAERQASSLLLRRPGRHRPTPFALRLTVPGRVEVGVAGLEIAARLRPATSFDDAGGDPFRVQFDAAAAGPELVVRSPQPGDRFVPLGMTGTKKLQDFWVDKKIPRADREGIPIVATTKGEVLWVVGHRMAETAKVTPATKRVVELEARPLEQ